MLLRILFVMGLFSSAVCFSHESPEPDDALLSEIFANQSECIISIVEDRIYVNPEKIFPTTQGLFLNVNEAEYIVIPTLHSDAQGCYIQQVYDTRVTKPCPYCGWERISGAFKCRNPNCPSNKPKEKK